MTSSRDPYLLLLIDGLNILRRCYEANPAPDSSDKARAACRSAFSSFRRALAEHRPSHVLAAFDSGGTTWRHSLLSTYRQSRKPMPQVLREEIAGFMRRLEQELGVVCVSLPEVEADDVLAAVFERWAERVDVAFDRVVVLSTDKDLAQLVAQGALVYDHFAQQWRDAAWIQAKFGVQPEQLGDLLALMGDSSDDIPGISGVGPKKAAKLLETHQTLEQVLCAASGIKGALGESLRSEAEVARLSRKLVSFKTDINVGVSWKELRLTDACAA